MRGNDQLNELLAKAEAAVKFEAGLILLRSSSQLFFRQGKARILNSRA